MSYTYTDMLKAAHHLQINGDFVTVTYHGSPTYTLQVVTSQGVKIHLYLEHDWVDGIDTVLWACEDDARSDGVVVESPHQVIADLSAQIQQLHYSCTMSRYLTLPTYQDGLNKLMLALTLEGIAETQHPTLVAEQAAAVVLNQIKMPDGVALSAQAGRGQVLLNFIHTDGETKMCAVPAWDVFPTCHSRFARPLMDTLMECIHNICDMSETLLHRGAR